MLYNLILYKPDSDINYYKITPIEISVVDNIAYDYAINSLIFLTIRSITVNTPAIFHAPGCSSVIIINKILTIYSTNNNERAYAIDNKGYYFVGTAIAL